VPLSAEARPGRGHPDPRGSGPAPAAQRWRGWLRGRLLGQHPGVHPAAPRPGGDRRAENSSPTPAAAAGQYL